MSTLPSRSEQRKHCGKLTPPRKIGFENEPKNWPGSTKPCKLILSSANRPKNHCEGARKRQSDWLKRMPSWPRLDESSLPHSISRKSMNALLKKCVSSFLSTELSSIPSIPKTIPSPSPTSPGRTCQSAEPAMSYHFRERLLSNVSEPVRASSFKQRRWRKKKRVIPPSCSTLRLA